MSEDSAKIEMDILLGSRGVELLSVSNGLAFPGSSVGFFIRGRGAGGIFCGAYGLDWQS